MKNQYIRVLVVDDFVDALQGYMLMLEGPEVVNPETARLKASILGKQQKLSSMPPFKVKSVSSGPLALKLVQASVGLQDPFQVAFVDLLMPTMSGTETIRGIWEKDPRVKVVIATAFAEVPLETIDEELGNAGDIGFLCKPFERMEVVAWARVMATLWMAKHGQEVSSPSSSSGESPTPFPSSLPGRSMSPVPGSVRVPGASFGSGPGPPGSSSVRRASPAPGSIPGRSLTPGLGPASGGSAPPPGSVRAPSSSAPISSRDSTPPPGSKSSGGTSTK